MQKAFDYDDPFIDDADDPPPFAGTGRHLRPPPGYGTYEDALQKIKDAVRLDLPPSPDLIDANRNLSRWEMHLGVGKVTSFPVRVNIALNAVCNARCKFCVYTPVNSTANMVRKDDIVRAKWLKFVERFVPNGGLTEPLIHPEITEILETVRTNAPFVKTYITSNGSLLNGRMARAIVGSLTEMCISLNAARKETYEFLMPPLKWEKTMGNLARIDEIKQEMGVNTPELQGSLVLNKHNMDELVEFPGILASVGIRKARIIAMNVPGTVPDRKLFTEEDLFPADKIKMHGLFDDFRAECRRHGVSLVFPLPVL